MDGPVEVDFLSMENDDLEWIVFDKRSSTEVFEDWLRKNLPSSAEKQKGIGWICVRNEPEMGCADECDLDGLEESWDTFLATGQPVTYEHIKELALNHNVKTGKWLFFAESGGKIDHLWSIVSTAIVQNSLPCISAKVSSYDGRENHVVCIYNSDFSNQEQVMSSEQAIRSMGIKSKLLYKPDVYSYLGVYSGNPWKIKPNILVSNFDILKGASVVTHSFGISQI